MKKSILLLLLAIIYPTIAASREGLLSATEVEYSSTHHNRFSLMLGLNPNLQKATNVTNFTFSFGKKMDNYWLDTNLILTNGLFSKLTTNNATATGLTDEQLVDTKSTHTAFGIGVGHETRYAQTLLSFTDIYELMAANITYNLFKEPTSGKSFSGPGMIAKFSVFKKFSDYVTAGTQFTYNLAVVKRAQDIDTESSSARSLTISYLTVGFDLSFYL